VYFQIKVSFFAVQDVCNVTRFSARVYHVCILHYLVFVCCESFVPHRQTAKVWHPAGSSICNLVMSVTPSQSTRQLCMCTGNTEYQHATKSRSRDCMARASNARCHSHVAQMVRLFCLCVNCPYFLKCRTTCRETEHAFPCSLPFQWLQPDLVLYYNKNIGKRRLFCVLIEQ
jgi:hypothetical protein